MHQKSFPKEALLRFIVYQEERKAVLSGHRYRPVE